MDSEAEGGKVVCVTGASGYLASWLVKHLLQRGYSVKATVRDPSNPKKTQHLLALEGAKERLQLFKAELLEEGAFDSVVDGCIGVFHTASPAILQSPDPQADIVDPAVNGTLNVLKSCAKVRSVRRVVLTSSMAALIYSRKPLTDVVVDESWWSDPDFCRERKLWYPLSKILAEEAAWKFAKENAIDLVVTNPTFVIGPLLQSTLSGSMDFLLQLVKGGETYPNSHFSSIDVRDVADAHIRAFEISSASGRYCLSATLIHLSDIFRILRELYPTLQLPEKCDENQISWVPPYYKTSMEKAKTLGISFTPLEVSLRDTIESLKEKGFLTI